MNTGINGRIKCVRKDQSLNQQEFGDKIGLKQGAISKMEQDGNAVIDQNIRLICDTFNVSEKWLRTGEGEMYEETNDVLLKQLATQYKLEGEKLELIRNFLMLDDEQQEAIVRAACVIAEANKKAMETAAAKVAAAPAPVNEPPADVPGTSDHIAGIGKMVEPPMSESDTPPTAKESPPTDGVPPAPEYYTPPGYEIVPEIEDKVKRYRATLYAKEAARQKLSTSPPSALSSEDSAAMQKSRP